MEERQSADLVRELADALEAILRDGHPVTSSTSRRGGVGGQAITMHCDLPARPDLVDEAYRVLYKARALIDGDEYCAPDCLDVNGGPCDTDGGGPCKTDQPDGTMES